MTYPFIEISRLRDPETPLSYIYMGFLRDKETLDFIKGETKADRDAFTKQIEDEGFKVQCNIYHLLAGTRHTKPVKGIIRIINRGQKMEVFKEDFEREKLLRTAALIHWYMERIPEDEHGTVSLDVD